MRVLVDTNIAIDILTKRQPHCAASEQFFTRAIAAHTTLLISTVSVADIMYITRKSLAPFPAQTRVVLDFINLMHIVTVKKSDLLFAFRGTMPDFEDAVQAHCAWRNRARLIISRNVPDYAQSPVAAIPPGAFQPE